jgi:hypothetical protein
VVLSITSTSQEQALKEQSDTVNSLLLTQNVHLAPSTQQAEQAGFTRAENHKTCQSIFLEN